MSDTPPTIDWCAWEPEAFARAAREDKPILLSLVAPWCEHCVAMDRSTYARADVARLVDARFVAIRVDTDRRPDINERYNLGGWPTTAFLTPDGQVFGGGTFIDAERMPGVWPTAPSTQTLPRTVTLRSRGATSRTVTESPGAIGMSGASPLTN